MKEFAKFQDFNQIANLHFGLSAGRFHEHLVSTPAHEIILVWEVEPAADHLDLGTAPERLGEVRSWVALPVLP